MKLPTLFIPKRDTDRKIEELKQKPEPKEQEDATLNELADYHMNRLFGSLPKIEKERIIINAIEEIIKDTFAGKIKWKEDNNRYSRILERYTAKAIVTSYNGKKIVMPVVFQTDNHTIDRWGYLHLGNERGPCRNTNDKSVKRLAIEHLGIEGLHRGGYIP